LTACECHGEYPRPNPCPNCDPEPEHARSATPPHSDAHLDIFNEHQRELRDEESYRMYVRHMENRGR
jgi:hypothetical protein